MSTRGTVLASEANHELREVERLNKLEVHAEFVSLIRLGQSHRYLYITHLE